MEELLHKVIVIGNPGVGKTSLLERYVNNNFINDYKPTVGVEYLLKVIQLSGKTLRLSFWDIASQENVKILTRSYFAGASACIIVFNVTDKKTFDDLRVWKREVELKLDDIPTLVLANKYDLVEEGTAEQCVDDPTLEAMMESIKVSKMFHVSAKTGYKVKHSMNALCHLLINSDSLKRPKHSTYNSTSNAITLARVSSANNANNYNNSSRGCGEC